MGLDVANQLFGNFHLNWAGTRWFAEWCDRQQLPPPFIGWGGFNDGDPCELVPDGKHHALARAWCEAFRERCPEIAEMGTRLLADSPPDLGAYLYPRSTGGEQLSEAEWERRAAAAWYAILQHGLAQGDTLLYY